MDDNFVNKRYLIGSTDCNFNADFNDGGNCSKLV